MEYQYCKRCLNISSRPRLGFNEEGICNACQWDEVKKNEINWKERWNKLEKSCDKYRCSDGSRWDVMVPCSGGKDGSYVAWKMKHDLGMHPLCVTLLPQHQTEIGRENLENFKKTGFDHIGITPNPQVYKRLAIKGFKEQGRPKMPFVSGISTVTMNMAMRFNLPFIMYGEEGESEYGGAMTQMDTPKIDRKYLVKYYYSGYDTGGYLNEFTKDELRWWLLPENEDVERIGLFPTHWSHYENWDPALHAALAKEKCGLQSIAGTSDGTFTNSAQLDDVLQDLHAYMMFVKFGFGRTTSDVCIEIRAGRMTREEGVKLAQELDGTFPEKYLPDFLNYFEMTKEEFWRTVNKFAHKELLEKKDNRWKLKDAAAEAMKAGGKFTL